MPPDLCELVRSDHTDLDRALSGMVDPTTSNHELTNLLEVFRLALAVHVAAEIKVLDVLPFRVEVVPVLRELIAQTRAEHVAQQATADALSRVAPGSGTWYGRALELRVLVLDHAARAELLRWTLADHVPLDLRRQLASEYATERLRLLATTSPLALASHAA